MYDPGLAPDLSIISNSTVHLYITPASKTMFLSSTLLLLPVYDLCSAPDIIFLIHSLPLPVHDLTLASVSTPLLFKSALWVPPFNIVPQVFRLPDVVSRQNSSEPPIYKLEIAPADYLQEQLSTTWTLPCYFVPCTPCHHIQECLDQRHKGSPLNTSAPTQVHEVFHGSALSLFNLPYH